MLKKHPYSLLRISFSYEFSSYMSVEVHYIFQIFFFADVLAISPAKEKFDIVLQEVFSSIPQLLCKESLPLSGSLPIKDDTDDDQNKQPVHNRKPPVKADVTTKVSELGSSDGFSKAHLVQSSLSSTKSSTRYIVCL